MTKTYFEIPSSLPNTPLLDEINYPADLKNFQRKNSINLLMN